jgi:23S rRNA (cytosine1962-C5)-methyltransferase
VQRRDVIIAALLECAQAKRVIERLDEERLRPEYGNNTRLIQSLKRDVPIEPALVEINDSQLRFQVDLANSQKTGFYLDQRDNRARVGAYCVGANMLNLFSYSGAFAVNALAAGAQRATNVDVSQDALNLAAGNAALNGQETTQIAADVFAWLRANKNQGTAYDVIVLDPPKMAHNPSQIDKAARAYKDANRLAMGMLKPGGVLASFSCSGVVSADLLQQIVFSAGIEAKRDVRIVERLSQASDHPVLTTYPESGYLKGLILRIE